MSLSQQSLGDRHQYTLDRQVVSPSWDRHTPLTLTCASDNLESLIYVSFGLWGETGVTGETHIGAKIQKGMKRIKDGTSDPDDEAEHH